MSTEFKRSSKRKQFRKRAPSDDESEVRTETTDTNETAAEEPENEAILLARHLRELRKRPRGLVGDVTSGDSMSTKTTSIKDSNLDGETKGGLVDLRSNFLAESQKGDIDREMLNFIDRELKKHRGEDVSENSNTTVNAKELSEKKLFELPSHLNVHSKIKGDDMMSQQMLEGIPEVDLGIANKIRNIEATEAAKQKLMEEKMNNLNGDKTYNLKGFVPNGVTVNFVQHNRWDGERTFKSLVPHAPTSLKKVVNVTEEGSK